MRTTLLAFLSTVALTVLVLAVASAQEEPDEPLMLPAWLLLIPDGGADKFHSTGLGSFSSPTMMQLGFQQADRAARRQTADVVRATVLSATTRYRDEVLQLDAESVPNELLADVTTTTVNQVLSGVSVLRRGMAYIDSAELSLTFSLTELAVSEVTRSVSEELARRLDIVRQRGNAVREEVGRLLVEEKAKNTRLVPAIDDSVPEELGRRIVRLIERALERPEATEEEADEAEEEAEDEDDGRPSWVRERPQEPGIWLYGVGSGTYRNQAMARAATMNAEMQARRQIADEAQAALRQALREFLDAFEEANPQRDTSAVRRQTLSGRFALSMTGVMVMDRFTEFDEANNQHVVHALARVSAESVRSTLQDDGKRILAPLNLTPAEVADFEQRLRSALGFPKPEAE